MPFYERIDAPATPAQKNLLKALSPEQLAMKELAGEPVRAALTAAPGNGQPFGGIKVTTDNGWFAARPSGTEDVYKIYAESFRSEAHLRQIQRRRRPRSRGRSELTCTGSALHRPALPRGGRVRGDA